MQAPPALPPFPCPAARSSPFDAALLPAASPAAETIVSCGLPKNQGAGAPAALGLLPACGNSPPAFPPVAVTASQAHEPAIGTPPPKGSSSGQKDVRCETLVKIRGRHGRQPSSFAASHPDSSECGRGRSGGGPQGWPAEEVAAKGRRCGRPQAAQLAPVALLCLALRHKSPRQPGRRRSLRCSA